jgi:branched-chain amino acid aminotransferase
LDPRKCSQPRTIVIVDELTMISPETRRQGVKMIVASTRRLSPDQLDPRIKTLNYLNQITAKQEASAAGADEAVLLNQAGRVAEGTADNIFIVKNGRLLTPPASEGALEGITRSVIIELAANLGIAFEECLLSVYDLFTSDECFLTGTGAELIPVASISGRHLPAERSIFCQLEAAFQELIYNGQ